MIFWVLLIQIRLDESQEVEAQKLNEKLHHELEILIAYQSKNKMQAEAQRDRERRELSERVSVRKSILELKVREFSLNLNTDSCKLSPKYLLI